MTFAVKGAPSEIRNFTNKSQPLNLDKGVGMTWQGAKKLRYGTHTIVVTAVDAQGNVGSAEVRFRKVNPRTLPAQIDELPEAPPARQRQEAHARRPGQVQALVRQAGQGARRVAEQAQGQVEEDPRRRPGTPTSPSSSSRS